MSAVTDKSPYVALRAFRFGTADLQPGDPVPVEAGRNYQMMLRVGQIGPASVTASAGQQEEQKPPAPYAQGDTVVFVAEDGAHTLVTFFEALEAPEEVREGLGLKEGDLVAEVTFPEDPAHATFVPLASLLPEQPTRRLIEDLTAQTREAEEETARSRAALATAREEGSAAQAQLATLKAEVEALRANQIPKDLRERVIAVKGVAEKLADPIVEAVKAPGTPTPPADPEG